MTMKPSRSIQGFTLIELMIVVMIIGILMAIVVPKAGYAIKKSAEATSKGSLGALRSTLSIYFSDTEGKYPTDNLASLVPNYASNIPLLRTVGYHGDSTQVVTEVVPSDSGQWSYDSVTGDPNFGTVRIGCTHTDALGKTWSTY